MRHRYAKKYLILSVMFMILLVCGGRAYAGISTDVVLHKSVLLNLKNPVERVSVATPEIAEVTLISPRQMQITGASLGDTSLIAWERGTGKTTFFDIHVMGDIQYIEEQIKIIAPTDDIKVRYVNEHIELYGHAKNQQTIDKAAEIAAAYAAKDIVRKETRQDGTVTEVTARQLINHIVIDKPQQVLLQVKVAQVDKTALRNIGISGLIKGNTAEGFYNIIGSPDGNISGNSSNALGDLTNLTQFTAGISYFPAGIGAVLQALVTKDLAKILAEPNLVVKSGNKGKFRAGSQIPYQVLSMQGGTTTPTIEYKDVGVTLDFAPEVLDNGLIRLKIDPAEVSSLGGTLQANGYPIINTRNVSTSAELRDGESLVLAGLLQENEIRTMSKIPLLGDIPILGALFRSTEKEITETELVFFITPKLVTAMAPDAKPDLPTDGRPTPEEEKELQWMPMVR